MRVLSAILLSCGLAFAQFSDVPREHWAEHAVTHLVDLGILTGYPDGTFQGQSAITRYEAALITLRLLSALNAGILEQASGLQDLQEQIRAGPTPAPCSSPSALSTTP